MKTLSVPDSEILKRAAEILEENGNSMVSVRGVRDNRGHTWRNASDFLRDIARSLENQTDHSYSEEKRMKRCAVAFERAAAAWEELKLPMPDPKKPRENDFSVCGYEGGMNKSWSLPECLREVAKKLK